MQQVEFLYLRTVLEQVSEGYELSKEKRMQLFS